MPPPTKKRKFITLEDKAAIIGEVEKGRKKMDIAEEFGVACSSLSTILKNKASILGALENGMKRPTDVDMFMALEMIAAAWIATSPAVITNCFTHAGLVTPQASCADPAEPEEGSPVGALDDGDSAVPPSLTSAWGELCAVANEIPDGLSVHEFVCADEGVIVHEEVTDEAIVSSVCEAGDPDEQRPEQPEKTTSPQDVLNAFDTIRSFFGEHDDDVAMDHFLQCICPSSHSPGMFSWFPIFFPIKAQRIWAKASCEKRSPPYRKKAREKVQSIGQKIAKSEWRSEPRRCMFTCAPITWRQDCRAHSIFQRRGGRQTGGYRRTLPAVSTFHFPEEGWPADRR
ncbi:hypothetical protein HPB50_019069 [Hyalomma asiaticum]|uniref:Uncharacterized protein n=1 Tax=Hyalomma asiaticum TaxID=266040 RepID=A0ACB7TJX3_HYAAI|nr:hypothetical protein HPB50_019069 [Hyalomma asiaticum]